ncbi:single-stranded-DNA-specific exonuclease RecJ [Leptospira meyeri]|uniref:single-stranded-DNA-specific exonuclease RecJ n=1 Tax=Leptospira meyeri TaxID=29508 RepID=UPI000C2A4049|nr:single-stranded-DNA-specific exonuclease RecJ [Leptospira meyeri]PJZ82852.1 single-stranded-DNA-specific exonuclease RecJ [Leptospira meyeri]PJZ97908.1 single-stranded-DNA-specific exonuclease RecJ [Leptospira meyeri]
MHHVTKVHFGPLLSEVRTQVDSKRPLLRYLVDKREGLRNIHPKELLTSDFSCLYSPFSLPDLSLAVELLLSFVKEGKKILLYGDRDSDGVSSTCLLAFFLKSHPAFSSIQLEVMVSSESDPYGLCKEALVKIKKVKPDLLVTLDFGSSQADEIEELTNTGIKVIVLDHHEVPVRIPTNCALVNPRRTDSQYPEKKICTAVLSFKLVSAILFRLSDEFGKVYKKTEFQNETGKNQTTYYQNGIQLTDETFTSLSLDDSFISPYPEDFVTTIPVDEERKLFYYQCSKIPDFFSDLEEETDLAGIGTITDMMPLVGENRHFVKLALNSLTKLYVGDKKRKGLSELLKELKLSPQGVTTKDLGWSIGPVLNSAGRMGKTEEAVSLLLSETNLEAKTKAKQLLSINEERKERTKRNMDRVERYFARKPERTTKEIVFCYEPDMEPGVSGIVATRMVDTYKKPAIFLAPDNGDARGSIRSYGPENVLELLESLSEHFLHFGGHPEAGGFSIKIDQIPAFESALYTAAKNWLSVDKDKPKVHSIETDFTVLTEEMGERLLKEWKDLEPFGQGNPDIKLGIRNAKAIHLTPLSGGKHVRFHLIGSGSLKFMIWNKGEEFQKFMSEHGSFDLVGSLEENFYQGRTTLQFIVEWFGIAEENPSKSVP